jgi:hypothetical protein
MTKEKTRTVRILCLVVCVFVLLNAHAQEKVVRGKVTYIASGTVFTSLGRDAGVQDSTLLFVVSRRDTIATVKVIAVSSKTSGCVMVKSSRSASIGDDVVGTVHIEEEKTLQPDSLMAVPAAERSERTPGGIPVSRKVVDESAVRVQGRVSAQYSRFLYDNSAFNIVQPGVIVNMRASLRDVPLRAEVYANFGVLSVGNHDILSKYAVNQSRIYGLSLTYDDGINVASLGRIIPTFSPSIGYVDGVLLSRKIGDIVVGTTLGFQPDSYLRNVATEYRKGALFAQYRSPDLMSLSMSATYSRTYFHSALDREAANVLVNSALSANAYLYANVEVDLRKKRGDEFVLSPRLTSAYINLSYRISTSLSLGVGGDASRSYYSFETVRRIPDSFLVDQLRSGVSVSLNWLLPWGISVYDTYTPRTSEGTFGKEYSNASSLGFSDLFATGCNLRSSYSLNENQYASSTSIGLSLQRSIAQRADITVRFNQTGYTVKQSGLRGFSTTLGCDLMVFITRALTFLGTYDRLDGYGTVSNQVFAEFGVRF